MLIVIFIHANDFFLLDLARVADIDHRNLISLTGSPGQLTKPKDWSEDIDYRSAQGNNQSLNGNDGFILESPLSSILEPPPPMEKFGQFFVCIFVLFYLITMKFI